MYRHLAGSCSGGPCPNLFVDDSTNGVVVQGYETAERPGPADPDEGFLHIPGDAFARLLMNLPTRMLIAALLRRPFRARLMAARMQAPSGTR